MQIDSKLIYAVAGSLITLLLVFLFQLLFLSNDLVPSTQTTAALECPTIAEEPQYVDTDEYQQNYNQTAATINPEPLAQTNSSEEVFLDECDEQCANNIAAQLISGKNLDEDDGFHITSEQANKVAKLIQEDPTMLAEFETTLGSLKGQDGRNSILYVFSQLQDNQVADIARKLSTSSNTRDRIDALSLLDSVSDRNPGVQDEIKQIITTENDPDILLKAIEASHSLSPNNVDSATRNRLSNLINTSSDDEIRSQALITKMNIVETGSELRADVRNALTSSSKRYKQAGLQALDNVLEKQKNQESSDDWLINNDLKSSVEKIANDPNADPRTRVEALNLIDRHYRNN